MENVTVLQLQSYKLGVQVYATAVIIIKLLTHFMSTYQDVFALSLVKINIWRDAFI